MANGLGHQMFDCTKWAKGAVPFNILHYGTSGVQEYTVT